MMILFYVACVFSAASAGAIIESPANDGVNGAVVGAIVGAIIASLTHLLFVGIGVKL